MNRIVSSGMKLYLLTTGVAVFAFFQNVAATGLAAEAHASGKPLVTDVCSILKNPNYYAMKEVSLRGSIYMGVDMMNISDKKCPGNPIKLVIKDNVINSSNIQSFYKKINNYGRHGVATVNGEFVSIDSHLTPYLINVNNIKDVSR